MGNYILDEVTLCFAFLTNTKKKTLILFTVNMKLA